MTTTVTDGGSPLSGITVSFSTSGATLSAASAVSNASGQATVTLRATTASKSTTTPSVTASYGGQSALRSVTLTGITIAEPTELNTVSGSGTNLVYWTPPSAGYSNGVLVLRRSGGTPQVPSDGTALNVGDSLADGSRVVAKLAAGGGTSVTDSGLTAGATYYYRAFSYFASGSLYSAAGASVDAPGTGTGANQPRWVYTSSTAGMADPTVDGMGGVLWGGMGGGVVDTTTTDGTRVWTPPLNTKTVTGGAVLTDINGAGWYAIVGTSSGTVAAIDLNSGAVTWESPVLGTTIGSRVTVQYRSASDATFQAQFTGDLVIVGTKNSSATNNKVYGLDAATGTVQWTFNNSGATAVDVVTGWPQVVYETNRVIVTTKSNGGTQASLWALSTITGSLVQSWSYGDITMGLGGASNGTLYVGTTSGKLYEFDQTSLAMAWTGPYDTGTNNGIVGWVWEDWDQRGRLYFSTSDGHVWALQTSGGSAPPSLVWKTTLAGASAPLVLESNGVLYVGASDGKIHELRLSDGVDQKQSTVGGGASAVGSPTWDSTSGWLYAPTANGKIWAVPAPLP